MNNCEELAKRCADAHGADRELDAAIARQMGEAANYEGDGVYGCKRYTASLDAALSLIPEGHDYVLEHVNGGLTIGARVGHNDPDRTSWGDTDALALCAAALRARGILEQQAPLGSK